MKRSGIVFMLLFFALIFSTNASAMERNVESFSKEEKEGYELTKKYEKSLKPMLEKKAITHTCQYSHKGIKATKKEKKNIETVMDMASKEKSGASHSSLGDSGSGSGGSTLGDSFDSRKFASTPVRNQDNYGLCYAFATTDAYALSYKYLHRDSFKKSEDKIKFSPWAMGGFMFNKHSDPLSLTDGDYLEKNVMPWSRESLEGGSLYAGVNLLAKGSGICLDKSAPYDVMKKKFDKGETAYLDEDIAYENKDIYLRESYYLDNIYDIKAVLKLYGVVSASYYSESNCYDYKSYAFYNPDATENMGNHAIVVVGWDDNYPKENFYYEPENDGAFLCKNSWGTAWGNDGYFWISYEEKSFGDVYAYDVQDRKYSHIYQYDGNPDDATWEITDNNGKLVSELVEKNDFVALQNEKIESCQIKVPDGYVKCTAYLEDASDALLAIGVAYKDVDGYLEIELEPLEEESNIIRKGEKFSIVVFVEAQEDNSHVSFYTENRDRNYISVISHAEVKPLQSFILNDDYRWEDVGTVVGGNLRIKALSTVVNLCEEDIDKINFRSKRVNVLTGEKKQLEVMSDGELVSDDLEIAYSSSDKSVARVDSVGNVIACKEGKATITATYDGKVAECTVNVLQNELEEITKADNYATESNPEEIYLMQDFIPEYDVEPYGATGTITWSVEKKNAYNQYEAAKIDPNGYEMDSDYDCMLNSVWGTFLPYKRGEYLLKGKYINSKGESVEQKFYINAKNKIIDCEKVEDFALDTDSEDASSVLNMFDYKLDAGMDKTIKLKHGSEIFLSYVILLETDNNVDADDVAELQLKVAMGVKDAVAKFEREKNVKFKVSKITRETAAQDGIRLCAKNNYIGIYALESYSHAIFEGESIEDTNPIRSVEVESKKITIDTRTATGAAIKVLSQSPENNNDKLTFKSLDTDIVTVDKDGNLTPKRFGSTVVEISTAATAWVSENDCIERIAVEVVGDKLEKIEAEKDSYKIERNSTELLKLNNSIQTKYKVRYESLDKRIVDVDEDGNMTGVSVGETTVKAFVCDVSTEVKVTVDAPLQMKVDDMQSTHNYVDGLSEEYIYVKEGAKALRIKFDSKTKLASDGDTLKVFDKYENEIIKYTTDFSKNEILIWGDTVKLKFITKGNGVDKAVDYGFKVKSIVEVDNPAESFTFDDVTIDVSNLDKKCKALTPKAATGQTVECMPITYKVVDGAENILLSTKRFAAHTGEIEARKFGKSLISATAIGKDGKPISYEFNVTVLDYMMTPTPVPTATPTITPSVAPTSTPEVTPSVAPTNTPEVTPSAAPTNTPEVTPSMTPTNTPEVTPSITPSKAPTATPSKAPTAIPEVTPTNEPTASPVITPLPTDTPEPQFSFVPGYRPLPEHTSFPIVLNKPKNDYKTVVNKKYDFVAIGLSKALAQKKTMKLSVYYKGEKLSYKKLIFKSSNKKYLTVSKKGKVKALKKGIGKKAWITVTLKQNKKIKLKYKIKIYKKSITAMKLSYNKKVKRGKTFYIKAKLSPSNKIYKHLEYIVLGSDIKISSKGKAKVSSNAVKGKHIILVKTLDGSNKKKKVKITVE